MLYVEHVKYVDYVFEMFHMEHLYCTRMEKLRISCQLTERATRLFLRLKETAAGFNPSNSQMASALIEAALEQRKELRQAEGQERKAKR